MKTDPVRRLISRIIDERGLDLAHLSKQLGRNHAYMHQYLNRGIPKALKEQERSRLAELLGVDEEQLGGPPRSHKLRDISSQYIYVSERGVRVSAGPGSHIEREGVVDKWPFPAKYVRHTLSIPGNELSVIEVSGDSMEPTLRSGDRIMIDHDDVNVAQPGVFALYDGMATVVKRVEKIPASEPPQIMLISDNPSHGRYSVLAEQVHIAGRVVWFGRRL